MVHMLLLFVRPPLLPSAVKVASGQFVVQAGLGHESVLHAGAQFVGADLKSVSCLN